MVRVGSSTARRAVALVMAWLLVLVVAGYGASRGVWDPVWVAAPLLVLLSACLFGARTGTAQAILLTVAAIVGAWLQAAGHVAAAPAEPTVVALVLALVLAAMAICGLLLQRTLSSALAAEDVQNERIDLTMRALRQRERVLRHAMRVETAGEVASMVVHQLRNQFQVILGLCRVGRASPHPAAEFDAIFGTVGAANEVLEDLLGLVRSGETKACSIDLGEAVRGIAGRLRHILPASLSLQLQVPSERLEVQLDPVGLEHAILNLVLNSKQAMPTGGEVQIRVRRSTAGSVELVVEDDGPGMPADLRDQVFEPFFTTKPRGEGTGLGLAAVRRFAIGSGGTVDLQTAPGLGARFVFDFPGSAAGAAAAQRLTS